MSLISKSSKRHLPDWMEATHGCKRFIESSSTRTTSLKCQIQAVDADINDMSRNMDVVQDKVTDKVDETSEQNSLNKCQNDISKPTVSQFIARSMPVLQFKGSIVYSYQDSDADCLCLDILSLCRDSDEALLVGFDMEWPVSYQHGSSNKTSLIQLCTNESTCYLFHVSSMMQFPKLLKHLLIHPQVVLLGLNIKSDLWKLERDFDIQVKPAIDRGSVIDVGKLANEKLKSSEKWDLDGLCRNVLRQRLNKDADLRCGDWSNVPLSEEKKHYAATDAFAGLALYKHLKNV